MTPSAATPAFAQESEQARASSAVAAHLGIFSTNPDWRDRDERVELQAGSIVVWYRRQVTGPVTAPEVCEAGRWLLQGRLDQTRGAANLFEAWPALSTLALIIYDVTTSVKTDDRGHYNQSRRLDTQIRLLLDARRIQASRSIIEAADLTGLDCMAVLKSFTSELNWNRE